MRCLHPLAVWGTSFLAVFPTASFAAHPIDRLQTEARGIYALWAQHQDGEESVMALPFIKGTQIVVQWAEVEPTPGKYDFSGLDQQLSEVARRGWWTTVQVNGNAKPGWLFDVVPHVEEKLHHQVRDKRGTLMFWHPAFQEAHLKMLRALAAHLKATPHSAKILGIRLNFNAIGTEQLRVPEALLDPEKWIVPEQVDRNRLVRYSDVVRSNYEEKVISTYESSFSDWVAVFVRNNINSAIEEKIATRLQAGRLALFHTSSEAEPRSRTTERQYGMFYDYSRSGMTLGYAEPWASAWGEHGGKNDPRWCSPEQWNYWTLLLDLHCGVSVIGEYFANLNYAATGHHGKDKVDADDAGPKEFMAAYTWAAEYVGRHNRPSESPGAWVAFRENAVVKAKNENITEEGRKLTRFTGDYDWLARRLPDDGSVGVGPVGPDDQRFGAFARRYQSEQVAQIKFDPAFIHSLINGATVRVTYLDEARPGMALASLWTRTGLVSLGSLPFKGTGRWITAEFPVTSRTLRSLADSCHLTLNVGVAPLTLHMVEVRRK